MRDPFPRLDFGFRFPDILEHSAFSTNASYAPTSRRTAAPRPCWVRTIGRFVCRTLLTNDATLDRKSERERISSGGRIFGMAPSIYRTRLRTIYRTLFLWGMQYHFESASNAPLQLRALRPHQWRVVSFSLLASPRTLRSSTTWVALKSEANLAKVLLRFVILEGSDDFLQLKP